MVLMDEYVCVGPLMRSDSMSHKWFEDNEKESKLAHFWIEHELLQWVLTNVMNCHVASDARMFFCRASHHPVYFFPPIKN